MINNGDNLPNSSKVVRYVGYGKMRRDEDDNTIGPAPSAFEERQTDDYLSVTWCEYFSGTPEEQLRCGIEAIRGSEITVKPKACFCVANTEELKVATAELGAEIREVYLPKDDNPAHAGIYGISSEEKQLLEMLATETWSQYLTKGIADALPLGKCSKAPDIG